MRHVPNKFEFAARGFLFKKNKFDSAKEHLINILAAGVKAALRYHQTADATHLSLCMHPFYF